MTTCAPSSTKRRTVASPMPEHPPVTTATLPCSRPAIFPPRGDRASTPGRAPVSAIGGRPSVAGHRCRPSVVGHRWSATGGRACRDLVAGDEDVLLLGEGVRGVGAELAAETGLLEAAERRPVAHCRVRVDAEVAGL